MNLELAAEDAAREQAGKQPLHYEQINRDAAECPGAPTIGDSLAAMMPAGDTPLTGKPVDTAAHGNKMSINDCPACGGRHEGLDIREYGNLSGPWTHWYLCPTLGDPCSVALTGMKGGQGMELDGKVCQALAAAQQTGQWLVAVFRATPDGHVHLNRTTCKFPLVAFEKCVEMLRQNLQSEVGPAQPDVMAQATAQPPLVDLLGDGAINPLD